MTFETAIKVINKYYIGSTEEWARELLTYYCVQVNAGFPANSEILHQILSNNFGLARHQHWV